jgi:hypothetical protein
MNDECLFKAAEDSSFEQHTNRRSRCELEHPRRFAMLDGSSANQRDNQGTSLV